MTTLNDVRRLFTDIENATEQGGVAGALRTGELLRELNTIAQLYLMSVRARQVADEYMIAGVSQRQLATEMDLSNNALSLWLKQFGPKNYVTVREEVGEDGAAYVVETVPAKPGAVKQALRVGRRVAPSRMCLDELAVDLGEVDGETLWFQLANQG